MKIVQSFWSKPMLNSNKNTYQNRFNGGWFNYRYALCAMAYSCLTLRRYYDDVELYTDNYGIELFRDELHLPYTRFHNILNNLDIDECFWATFLAYFQDYITGNELCEYIKQNNLIEGIDIGTIKENIFYMIIQNVYDNNVLELKVD